MTLVNIVDLSICIPCRLPLVGSLLCFRDLRGAVIRPFVGVKLARTPVGARVKKVATWQPINVYSATILSLYNSFNDTCFRCVSVATAPVSVKRHWKGISLKTYLWDCICWVLVRSALWVRVCAWLCAYGLTLIRTVLGGIFYTPAPSSVFLHTIMHNFCTLCKFQTKITHGRVTRSLQLASRHNKF